MNWERRSCRHTAVFVRLHGFLVRRVRQTFTTSNLDVVVDISLRRFWPKETGYYCYLCTKKKCIIDFFFYRLRTHRTTITVLPVVAGQTFVSSPSIIVGQQQPPPQLISYPPYVWMQRVFTYDENSIVGYTGKSMLG